MKTTDLNLRHFARTRRWLLLTIGMGLAAVVVIGGGIGPSVNRTLAMQQNISKQKKALDLLQAKIASFDQAETLQVLSLADKIDQALPSAKPLRELTSGVNQAAGDAQVVITTISLSPGLISTGSAQPQVKKQTKVVTGYEDLEITLTVEGTLSQLNQFFVYVEQMLPLTIVSSISLTELPRQTTATGELLFQADVTLKSFFFTKSVSAAIDDPIPELGALESQVLLQLPTFRIPPALGQNSIVGGGQEDLFAVPPNSIQEL